MEDLLFRGHGAHAEPGASRVGLGIHPTHALAPGRQGKEKAVKRRGVGVHGDLAWGLVNILGNQASTVLRREVRGPF